MISRPAFSLTALGTVARLRGNVLSQAAGIRNENTSHYLSLSRHHWTLELPLKNETQCFCFPSNGPRRNQRSPAAEKYRKSTFSRPLQRLRAPAARSSNGGRKPRKFRATCPATRAAVFPFFRARVRRLSAESDSGSSLTRHLTRA